MYDKDLKGKKNRMTIHMYDKTTKAILVFVLFMTVQADYVLVSVLFCLDLLRAKIKYSHTTTHSSVKYTLRIVQDFPSPFWAFQCFWALKYAKMTDFAINIITV